MNLPMVRKQEVWDPFQQLSSLQEEMSRLFGDMTQGHTRRLGNGSNPLWTIPINVHETNDLVMVKAELPGLEPKDIDVSVIGTVLTIKAERKQEKEVQEGNVLRQEMAYGYLERQIQLPDEVKPDMIQANYKNGILELRMPKQESAQRKKIKVEVK